jgi:hypothetical protein
MKTNFLSLLGVLIIFSLFGQTLKAQSNMEETDLIQSVFGMEKKAMVSEFIQVDGEAGQAFWSLYDQYETERKAHGKKRIALLNKYAEDYFTMDDAGTEVIMKEMISLGNDYDKLITKYYKSIKKQSGVKTAAQFYQLEAYFQSSIRKMIFENIPIIGELDN